MARGRTKGEWRKPGRRQNYRVLAPERHLIVCEGTKTEPLYFAGMRDAMKPEFRNRIHIVVKGTGLHTIDLFEYALRECRLSGGFDHVWLVYDCDNFNSQEFDSVVEKCSQSPDGTTTFHPLWSNPCIEVWFLLHFGYTTAEMTTAEVIARVDAVFQRELKHSYEKNGKNAFSELAFHLQKAIDNAKQQLEWHISQDSIFSSQMNPGTRVFEIIQMLSPYLSNVDLKEDED